MRRGLLILNDEALCVRQKATLEQFAIGPPRSMLKLAKSSFAELFRCTEAYRLPVTGYCFAYYSVCMEKIADCDAHEDTTTMDWA